MSNNDYYYLKDDVYFEPLINQWYAWPYLFPPVTCARHMVNTHRRIMVSFVQNYQLHIIASTEPGLTGGEFLSCTEEQVEDIRGLIKYMDVEHSDMVELSNAVKQLDELLLQHTSGETIESLYKDVPEPLQGFVELFMDMNHNASYRLFESLLYRSKYYKKGLQKVSFGTLSKVDERAFVLSTPRLPDDNHLQLNVDFTAPEIDKIFRSRKEPLHIDELKEIFSEEKTAGGLSFLDLFSNAPSDYQHEEVIDDVVLHYTGHAGFLLETKDLAILVDPVIATRGAEYADDVISFSQLPDKIDYICLTHNHQDHVNLESLLQVRHKTDKVLVPKNNGGTLADPSIRLLLKQLDFDVIEFDDMDEIPVPGGKIMSIPFVGEHGDLNIRSKTAWYYELHGNKMLLAADSSNLDIHMYEHVHKAIGDLDLLAIGMECIGAPYTWLYGALHTQKVPKKVKDSRRLNGSNAETAFQVAEIFKPKDVYIYALGAEPWYKYFMGLEYDDDSVQLKESNQMIKSCEGLGMNASRLYGKHSHYFK